jgi:hypothetical protein
LIEEKGKENQRLPRKQFRKQKPNKCVCVKKNLSRAKKASYDSSRDTSIGAWSRGASLLWFKRRR